MFWCSTPPLFRRMSLKKSSFSDFVFSRHPSPDSKHSDSSTYVDFTPTKPRLSIDFDVLFIGAGPTPPPKDQTSVRSPSLSPPPTPSPLPSVAPLRITKRSDKPLPIPRLDPVLEDEPVYAWYTRRVQAQDGTSKYTPSQPSLFPRTDFAISASGSLTAALHIFGGLVNERAKNEVYTISVKDHSVKRLHTVGDYPSPRFGQASAEAGSVMVVWGGDTSSASSNQLRTRLKYDNALYFLNLTSREWTRISVDGPAPPGRVGHTVVMIGPRIYVFGGEADGEYFNDLWCFSLGTLVSKPAWEQIDLLRDTPPDKKPPKRSGHVCVAYGKRLIVFGGTDGQYHYNDTWSFDTLTKTWTELPCTGYIPCPREGHAATLVGDIMYVFGGRGVDGANIGRLAAFKISSQRWFMFQNMGPEPSPRSGHGMATVGTKVYVMGGVSEDDLDESGAQSNIVYVLDTNHIKYPSTKFSTPHTRELVP